MVVMITAASKKEAALLAEKLLASKVAACVNMVPVTSLFTWKGKAEKTREIMLLVKSQRNMFSRIEKLVRRYHGYEVPEIIALPVVAGSAPYLAWIRENTG
jgi:periplasmic divalent cation tolerance protein